eukprot:scaffold494_cov245-Pinguiococcus_pyrenoidosus.AAC.18
MPLSASRILRGAVRWASEPSHVWLFVFLPALVSFLEALQVQMGRLVTCRWSSSQGHFAGVETRRELRDLGPCRSAAGQRQAGNPGRREIRRVGYGT